MQATADSLAFAPPREPAAVRGFFLAAIAHVLLIVALTWGINWDKNTAPAAVEAELWSALPQEAAPPPPPPAPEPQVVQAPPVVQAPAPPVENAPDINIEREKKRKQEEARKREEEEERKLLEAQKKKQQQLEEKLAREKAARELAAKEKAKQELDARRRDQLRKEQIARMQALAGAGHPASEGTAAKSSGPSADYASRVAALIRRNTSFTESLPGDPGVEVEIRLAPDGMIVGTPKVVKSSGNAARDDAVVRGIIRTERLPRDRDGRIYSPMIIAVKQFGS